MLKKDNERYSKLSLLNNSQENIISVFNQGEALSILTCEFEYDSVMTIRSINYSIYKVFENTNAFDVSNRIASACIKRGKGLAALIDNVAVAEFERNRGYGTLIVTRLINDAELLNVNRLFGNIYNNDIDTPEKLARFDHFYKKLGFELDYDKLKLYKNL
ncbi:MAG: GNAT family N-acetyltransferase [Ruminococcus sp.]|nr:GNAT family N-acetyltransferase [Ruminococcus sp.]